MEARGEVGWEVVGWVMGAAGRVEEGVEVVGWAAAETARAGADWVEMAAVAMEAAVDWVRGAMGREAEGAVGEGKALVVARAATGGAAHYRSCTQAGKARGGGDGSTKLWCNPRARVAFLSLALQSGRSPTNCHTLLPVIDDASLPHFSKDAVATLRCAVAKSAHKRSIGINQNQIQKRRHWPAAGGHHTATYGS